MATDKSCEVVQKQAWSAVITNELFLKKNLNESTKKPRENQVAVNRIAQEIIVLRNDLTNQRQPK
jgi:hypothetical protein